MAAPFTTQQVMNTLAATIVEVVGAGPKVYPYNCLDYKSMPDGKPNFGEWPGLFTYGDEGEYIHGWVIKRTARHSDIREAGCEDGMWPFDLWGFFGWSDDLIENPTNVFTSSDGTFGQIVDNVADRFNRSQLIVINGHTVRHEGLQFPALTPLRAGERLLHFAGGHLDLYYTT